MNIHLVHFGLLVYALSALFYLSKLVFKKRILAGLGKRFLLLGFLFQSCVLALYFYKTGYPFIINSGYAYYFSAWVLAGLFLLVSSRYHLEVAGAFSLMIILTLSLFGHIKTQNYDLNSNLLSSPWAAVHIVFAFLAFSIFTLCFIMGVLFLVQEYQLKHKKNWTDKLPSLEILDQLHYKALALGFALLTFGIISGSAWAKSVKGVYFFDDPRQLWTIIAWLLYGVFFQVRFSSGWKGRRSILLSLLGFVVILFTFIEVQHL